MNSLIFFILILMPQALWAIDLDPVVVLTDSAQSLSLGRYLHYYEDPTGELTFADISQPDFEPDWVQSKTNCPNFGFTQSAYWVRVRLHNTTSAPKTFMLEYAQLRAIEVDFYLSDGRRARIGMTREFSKRPIDHRNSVLPLTLNPDQLETVYVRVRTYLAMALPFNLYTPLAFTAMTNRAYLGWGLYFGLIAIMALYNLFLFFGLRDLNYLYYTLWITFLGSFQFSFQGFGFQYIWSDGLWWNDHHLPMFATLGGFFGIRFTQSFLRTTHNLPKIHRLLSILKWLLLANFLMAFFFKFFFVVIPFLLIGLLFLVLCIGAGIIRMSQGYRPAKFFLLGWTFLPLGGIITILFQMGFLPDYMILQKALAIGSASEAWLLSMALADRYKVLRQENEAAQARALQLEQQASEELEQKVNERTKELTSANEKLIELDRFKQNMMGMIVHDLKNPLNVIMSALHSHSLESQVNIIKQASRQMIDLVQNILDVQKFEDAHIELHIENYPATRLIEEAVRQVRFLVDRYRNPIVIEAIDNLTIQVDVDMIIRVLVNLLTNAIKFTSEDGQVTVKAEWAGNGFVKISVVDTGQGIPPDLLATIFDKFTQVKLYASGRIRSSGLGLTFCKTIVEAHGGQIGIESITGVGSVLWCKLPGAETAALDTASAFDPAELISTKNMLNHDERAYLKPFADRLKNIELFEVTAQIAVIDLIDAKFSEPVQLWLIALKEAIHEENEDVYETLLDIDERMP